MNPDKQIDQDNDRIGRFTITCRYVCSALVRYRKSEVSNREARRIRRCPAEESPGLPTRHRTTGQILDL